MAKKKVSSLKIKMRNRLLEFIEKMKMGECGSIYFQYKNTGKLSWGWLTDYSDHCESSQFTAYQMRHLLEYFYELVQEKHIIKKRRFKRVNSFVFQKVGCYDRKVLVEKYRQAEVGTENDFLQE